MLKEYRRHERRRLRGQVELSWAAPGGKTCAVTANCLDVSVYGMLIESPSAVAAGTELRARLPGSGVSGEAVVRHCKQYGPWFRIGLRFVGALLLPEVVPHIEEPLIKYK
jgi:hypothetical protein